MKRCKHLEAKHRKAIEQAWRNGKLLVYAIRDEPNPRWFICTPPLTPLSILNWRNCVYKLCSEYTKRT